MKNTKNKFCCVGLSFVRHTHVEICVPFDMFSLHLEEILYYWNTKKKTKRERFVRLNLWSNILSESNALLSGKQKYIIIINSVNNTQLLTDERQQHTTLHYILYRSVSASHESVTLRTALYVFDVYPKICI